MGKSEYLDWNATTPVRKEVVDVMNYYFTEEFGNAGSRTHSFGLEAKKVVTLTREIISAVANAEASETIFTSGATESNNIAILGLAEYGREVNKRKIITTSIEHKAVLEPYYHLERNGFEVNYLSVDRSGRVDPEELVNVLDDDTLLVSIMHVNNETGIRQPIEECCEVLKNHNAFFHVDAAQGFAKEIPPLKNKRIDFISISGHKVQGPKGIGALIMRKRKYRRPPLKPLIYGGGQELGLRPGTLAVPLIAGLGKAIELISLDNEEWWNSKNQKKLQLLKSIDLEELDYELVGDQEYCMPNCFFAVFKNWDSEAFILAHKDRWALSNGSACTSDRIEPSHVLKAMDYDAVRGGVRFSF
jgi:cysteine desulfurase